YVRPAPLRQALTALALDVGTANPFRLPELEARPEVLRPGKVLAHKRTLGERLRGVFRGLAIEATTQLRQPGPQTAVHIAPAADYNADLADVVRRQYETFR